MIEGTPYIQLRLCLAEPPELFQLIEALSAIGNQFDEYVRREFPEHSGNARLFVYEIRKGSIIIDLVPQLTALIATMDMVLAVDNFVARFGGAITSLSRWEKLPNLTRGDIADFTGAVSLIGSHH